MTFNNKTYIKFDYELWSRLGYEAFEYYTHGSNAEVSYDPNTKMYKFRRKNIVTSIPFNKDGELIDKYGIVRERLYMRKVENGIN